MQRVLVGRSAGVGALVVLAVIGMTGCRPVTPSAAGSTVASAAPGSAPDPRPTVASPRPVTASPSPTQAPSPTSARTRSAPPKPLGMGSSGPAVVALQRRLAALGYWPGAVDGRFGDTTRQAVYAVQKAARLRPTGVVNAATEKALESGVRPKARSTSGHVIEVNLARGLLLFVTDGHVDYALNDSTGGGYVYYDQGVRAVAVTPKGHFTTYRVINGMHRSTLGLLFRPRYFNGGIAIHGDSYVPARPVSHGCVRISDAAIDWIWANNLDPIGTSVWVY